MTVLIFVVLQQGYLRASPAVKAVIVRDMNAKAAGHLLRVLMPAEQVQSNGSVITGLHATVDIKNGCEGFEVLLIFAAVMLAYPLSWRWRLLGLSFGFAIIYFANLLRIASLYYLVALHPEWFDAAHVLIWQTLMIGLTLFVFVLVVWLDQKTRREIADR